MKVRLFALVLPVAVALLLLACGGGFDIPEDPTATTSSGSATSAATSEATGSTSSTGASPTGSTGDSTSADSTPLAGGGGLNQSRYTVVAGDAPSIIAEKLGVPAEQRAAWIEELLAINDVTATTLQVGQELILPPTP